MAIGIDDRVTIEVGLDTSSVTAGASVVQDSMQKIAGAGVTAAQGVRESWTQVGPEFGRVQVQIQQLARSFQDTGQVSAQAVAGLGVSVKNLQKFYVDTAAAATTLSQAEKAIFQTAQATYDTSIRRLKEYNAELERVRSAAGKTVAPPVANVAPQFAQLEKQIQTLGKRYQETGLMGSRSIAALGVALKQLESQHGRNIDAAQALSQAEKQIFADARSTYTDAIAKQRAFNEELRQVNVSTNGIRSLNDLLNALPGKFGQVATSIGLMGAALGAGWTIGKKLDSEFLSKIPGYKKSWEDLADAVYKFDQRLRGIKQPQLTPLTQSYLPAIGEKGFRTELELNLQMGMQARGVKTFSETQGEVKAFEDALGLLRVQRDNFAKDSTFDKYLRDNKGKVQGWVQEYVAAGEKVPESLRKINQQLTSADAGATFAKSAQASLKATQDIENQFVDLQAFIAGLELQFQPPETDPIQKALQEVQTMAEAAFDKIAARQGKLRQDMDNQKLAAADFDAQINKIRSEGGQGLDIEAQINALKRRRDEALKQVEVDKEQIRLLDEERVRLEGMAGTLRQIRADDELSKMFAKSTAEAIKLQQEIEGIAAAGSAAIAGMGLPAGLASSLQAQIAEAERLAQKKAFDPAQITLSPEARAEMEALNKKLFRTHVDGLTAGAKVLGDRLQKVVEDLARATDQFAGTMADLFTAGVTGGAKGFADAASRLFLQGVNDGAKNIFKQLASVAFGAPPDRGEFIEGKLGDEFFVEAQEDAAKQQQKIMSAVLAAVGAVSQTIQIFQNAKKGEEVSVLGTALSFAATGAAIGGLFTLLGAAIGAVVGALAGLTIALIANAKAQKAQPYAAYGIRDGEAYVEPFAGKEGNFANVTQGMMNDMLSQMTKTLESTRNDYVKLLMRFPEGVQKSLMDGVTAANFAPTMDQYEMVSKGWAAKFGSVAFGVFGNLLFQNILGWWNMDRKQLVSKGDIGNPLFDKAAQKNFMQDFQNWVNNTLPKEIIASFEAPLAMGFEGLGLAADKFSQIWERLQAIDPKDAIKSLNDLYDALSAFKGAEKFLSKDRLYGGAGFIFEGGLLGDAQVANLESFADKLAQADVGLVQMGATIDNLVGPEQIAQAKTWGDALMQREQAVKQFFQQVAMAIDNVIQSYQASIRDLTLAGMKTAEGAPDINAQVNYLKQYADSLYGQIQNAPTIEIATELSNELQKTILQIQQIGGSQSVHAAEAFRLWAIEQLKGAQDLVVTRLQELAQDVADQNNAFLDAIQEFIDAFRNATDQINDTAADNATTSTGGPGAYTGGTKTGNETGNPRDTDYYGPPTTPPPPEPPLTGREHIPVPYVPQPGIPVVPPPVPPTPESFYAPEGLQSHELIADMAEGGRESVVLLRRIEALLAAGGWLRGEIDVNVNGEPTGATVPLTDGFPGRQSRSYGRI